MTKKLLIFVVILTSVTAIFAENEKVSCESDYGTCSLERSDKDLETHCFCHNGNEHYFSDSVIEGFNDGPLTEEWCHAKIDNLCKKIDAQCSNNAGSCDVNRAGKYVCYCSYVAGKKTGNGYFGVEGCNEILVEMCGSETPTPRKICPEEFLDICITYLEKIFNTCFDPIDDINDILDAPLDSSTLSDAKVQGFAGCCGSEYGRKEYKREYDCIERFRTCEDQECCVCTIQGDCGNEEDCYDFIEYPDSEEGDVYGDGIDANAQDGSNKKEKSKSDGCSMLFI